MIRFSLIDARHLVVSCQLYLGHIDHDHSAHTHVILSCLLLCLEVLLLQGDTEHQWPILLPRIRSPALTILKLYIIKKYEYFISEYQNIYFTIILLKVWLILLCNVILLASFHTQSTLLIYWIKCKECRECWWIRIESSEPTSWQLGPKFLDLIDRLNPLLCSTGHQNK